MKPKFLKKLLFFAMVLFCAYAFCQAPAFATEPTPRSATVDKLIYQLTENADAYTATLTGIDSSFTNGDDISVPSAIYEKGTFKVTTTTYVRDDAGQFQAGTPVVDTVKCVENNTFSATAASVPPKPTTDYKVTTVKEENDDDMKLSTETAILACTNVLQYQKIESDAGERTFEVTNINLRPSSTAQVNTFSVPSSVTTITSLAPGGGVTKYAVDESSSSFKATSAGLLLTNDGTTLVAFPLLMQYSGDSYSLDTSIKNVGACAFACVSKFDGGTGPLFNGTLVLHSKLTSLDVEALSLCGFECVDARAVPGSVWTPMASDYNCFMEHCSTLFCGQPDEYGTTWVPTLSFNPNVRVSDSSLRVCAPGFTSTSSFLRQFAPTTLTDYDGSSLSSEELLVSENLVLDPSRHELLGLINRDYVTSVRVPDTVTNISDDAFQCCNKLATVDLGNGVTSLPAQAFLMCSSLKSVKFGSFFTLLRDNAFQTANVGSLTFSVCPLYISPTALTTANKIDSISVPCNCPLSVFKDAGLTVNTKDNTFAYTDSYFSTVVGQFILTHDPIYNDDNEKTVCSLCGTEITVTDGHTCSEFSDATCKSAARCLVCGKTKDGSEPVDDAHVWIIDPTTGEPTCSLCNTKLSELSSNTAKKIILTRTVSVLSYNSDTEIEEFNGNKVDSPTPSNPEVLTWSDCSYNTFLFTLKLTNPDFDDIRDYRVTANNSILTGTDNNDGTYQYEVYLDESLTLINIECPYHVSNTGRFVASTDGGNIYRTTWRNQGGLIYE